MFIYEKDATNKCFFLLSQHTCLSSLCSYYSVSCTFTDAKRLVAGYSFLGRARAPTCISEFSATPLETIIRNQPTRLVGTKARRAVRMIKIIQ